MTIRAILLARRQNTVSGRRKRNVCIDCGGVPVTKVRCEECRVKYNWRAKLRKCGVKA